MKRRSILWVMVGVIFGVLLSVQAAELKVPGQYSTIQAAIDAAGRGDTVLIADGTYTGEGNRDLDFKDKAITVRSQNGAETCILDCQGSREDPHRGFIFHSGETASSVLEGLTLRKGCREGAGILCEASSPTIQNCILEQGVNGAEHPTFWSVLACTKGSSATILQCVIRDNPQMIGIAGEDGTLTVQNCEVTGNWTGIYFKNSQVVISGCRIAHNTSSTGGGIYGVQSLDVTIRDCILQDNQASRGGGIYLDTVSGTIHRCLIQNNRSTGNDNAGTGWDIGGGGICCLKGKVRIDGCTIAGNVAQPLPRSWVYQGTVTGGGIFCNTGVATLINCTIRDNLAQDAGGACVPTAGIQDGRIVNCTFVNNQATGSESEPLRKVIGGLSCEASVLNCIFLDNSPYGLGSDQSLLQNNLFFHNGEGDCFYQEAVYTGAAQINTLPGASKNLEGDPLFVKGRYGDYYLSQKAAGQSQDSPGVDAGSDTAIAMELDQMFTRTDGGLDTSVVDLGRHYSSGGLAENYKLTVTVNGGQGTISPASGYYASGSVVQLKASADPHYFVKKWTGTDQDASIAATNTVTMLMDRTISVEFEFGYQIQRRVEGQGVITTNSNRNYFTPGEQVTLNAVPKEGWMFDHWAGELSGTSNPISFNVHSDMSVQAVFIKRSALSILKLGEGTITRTPSLSAYPANSRVTLTAVPASGWVFRKWSGDLDSASSTIVLLLDKDKSIEAEFVPDGSQSNLCPLSVFVSGKGSVSPFGGAFARNSPVTLTAAPEKGWRFVRWMGDVEAPIKTTTVTLTMDRARTLTAVFEEETSGTTVIPNTEEDTDEDSTDDPISEDSSTDDTHGDPSDLPDILNNCSFPATVILLALMIGLTGLRTER